MPDFPISVVTDFSTGPGVHTHFSPQPPPLPSIGIVKDCKQSGISVFSYLSPVTVKGGTGISVGPSCPGGTFEVKEGMETVLTTDIPSAFFPAATEHCQTGTIGAKAMNMILPGAMNRLSVWVGGPVVGLGKAGGLWGSFFKSLGLGGGGQDGTVDPAETDGSDADARSGGTNPDGSGNGSNPNGENEGQSEEDEKKRIYPFEALLIVDGLTWTPSPSLVVTIRAGGESKDVPFSEFVREGQLGPFDAGVTQVDISLNQSGSGLRIEADTSTVEVEGGSGGSSGGGS